MLYRDLIPSRLGGRYIASHISIPGGGPVADWVHYHRVALQMIFVRRGWVRVVYEDQGEPFVMNEGDLVLAAAAASATASSRARRASRWSRSARRRSTRPSPTTSWTLPNGDNRRARLRRSALPAAHRGRHALDAFDGGEAQETRHRDATGGLAEARLIRPRHRAEIAFRRMTASWCSASCSMARARSTAITSSGPPTRS